MTSVTSIIQTLKRNGIFDQIRKEIFSTFQTSPEGIVLFDDISQEISRESDAPRSQNQLVSQIENLELYKEAIRNASSLVDMFEEQIKVHLQDVMDGKSIAVVPKVEKIPEPIKPVVEETARSATPIAIAPDESILDVSKESDKIKSEVFKERSVPEVVTIDKPTDQKMEEVSVKKPEKLELEEESLPNMIDPILPAVSKPADKPVERAKFEKMEITTNEPIQNPRKNAPIPEFATKSHQKPPEKTETSRKIEQSVTKKPVKKEDKAEKPPLKKPSSQSKTTNAVESFQPEALLGRTVAAFVPVMVEDEEDEEMERESCYVVKVRRYDERTRLYTVIDPEPDADEPMPTVWEIPRSKIVEYKRPRITSEGKLADIQIGDLVFALYREDGSKTPSTEFYKAMVKKFVKESVIVSYIDGDNENNLAFHELFKPPPYPALRKNESRNSDSSTGSQSDKYNRKRDAGVESDSMNTPTKKFKTPDS